jgi:dolichol-phosphate mannosyltransferase
LAALAAQSGQSGESVVGEYSSIVVMPTFNEIESLEGMVARVRSAVPGSQVLIVDDSSPDGTGALADRIASGDDSVSVLHRHGKDGLGRAYLDGFAVALAGGYDYIAQIDADGSHDPAELPAMFDLAHEGADLVIGSRWVDGGSIANWPWLREAISRAGNTYARLALRSTVHDLTAGFRVFRAEMLSTMQLEDVASQGYCFQVETAWRVERAGGAIIEHPITFIERATGHSKMHLGIVLEALIRVTAWGFTRRLQAEVRPTSRN